MYFIVVMRSRTLFLCMLRNTNPSFDLIWFDLKGIFLPAMRLLPYTTIDSCHHVKRRLQLRFDCDSTAVRLQFNHATTIRRPTLRPTCCVLLYCGLNKQAVGGRPSRPFPPVGAEAPCAAEQKQRSTSFPRPTCSLAHRCSRLTRQHGGEQSDMVTLTFDL